MPSSFDFTFPSSEAAKEVAFISSSAAPAHTTTTAPSSTAAASSSSSVQPTASFFHFPTSDGCFAGAYTSNKPTNEDDVPPAATATPLVAGSNPTGNGTKKRAWIVASDENKLLVGNGYDIKDSFLKPLGAIWMRNKKIWLIQGSKLPPGHSIGAVKAVIQKYIDSGAEPPHLGHLLDSDVDTAEDEDDNEDHSEIFTHPISTAEYIPGGSPQAMKKLMEDSGSSYGSSFDEEDERFLFELDSDFDENIAMGNDGETALRAMMEHEVMYEQVLDEVQDLQEAVLGFLWEKQAAAVELMSEELASRTQIQADFVSDVVVIANLAHRRSIEETRRNELLTSQVAAFEELVVQESVEFSSLWKSFQLLKETTHKIKMRQMEQRHKQEVEALEARVKRVKDQFEAQKQEIPSLGDIRTIMSAAVKDIENVQSAQSPRRAVAKPHWSDRQKF